MIMKGIWYTAAMVLLMSSQVSAIEARAEATKASVVSNKLAGRKTASGKRFHPGAITAASKTLPLGCKAIVKNKKTGKSTCVTITDRGPFVQGRGLDLSKGAANKIGAQGVTNVDVKKVAGTNKTR
jgi:rare lipoprotein A